MSSDIVLHPGPIYAVLGDVIQPNEFWATEVPHWSDSDCRGFQRVTKMEAELAKLYQEGQEPGAEVRLTGNSHFIREELREGMMVAFRLDQTSKLWYRGKVVALYDSRSEDLCAVLFMVDYGRYCHGVSVRSNVRVLPRRLSIGVRALSFRLVVGGLRPLTLDVNYDAGKHALSKAVGNRWNERAVLFVRELMARLRTRLVEVTNYSEDRRGRVHGRVKLLGLKSKPPCYLHQVLKSKGFAAWCGEYMTQDLREKTPLSLQSSSILSKSSSSFKYEDTFDQLSERSSEQDVTFNSSISMTSNGPLIGRRPWRSVRIDAKRSILEETNESSSSEDANRSVWEVVKVQNQMATRNRIQREDDRKVMFVPSGIDVGKFLEEQLRRVSTPTTGPKLISSLPEFNKGQTVETLLNPKEIEKWTKEVDEGW